MFTKNSYITNGEIFRKVLETLGDLVFVSFAWGKNQALKRDNGGFTFSEHFCATCTQKELVAIGYHTCTAEEAGMPAEKWRPEDGEKYYYIDSFGDISGAQWRDESGGKFRLHVGNVYKTREDAEQALAKLKDGME